MSATSIGIPNLQFFRSRLTGPMWLFLVLQSLDLVTTAVILSQGGMEVNPFVRSAMGVMGPIFATALFKITIAIAVLTLNRKAWLLKVANIIYLGIVGWNMLVLVLHGMALA